MLKTYGDMKITVLKYLKAWVQLYLQIIHCPCNGRWFALYRQTIWTDCFTCYTKNHKPNRCPFFCFQYCRQYHGPNSNKILTQIRKIVVNGELLLNSAVKDAVFALNDEGTLREGEHWIKKDDKITKTWILYEIHLIHSI